MNNLTNFPLLVGGEVHNSSSSSPAYMDTQVWDRMVALDCQVVLTPVSWQLIEPMEGQFDFTTLEALLDGGRKRGIQVIPLWFGAYKNTWSSYAPDWVKRCQRRFLRAELEPGRPSGQLSVFCPEVLRADAAAFAAVMRKIAQIDPDRSVVPAVQVENEVGILCAAARDQSKTADQVWASPVPAELLAHLAEHHTMLHPTIRNLWESRNAAAQGTWPEVFGDSLEAREVFMAWHFAKFVGSVAAAGKAEHDLPMFANAWTVQAPGDPPGRYPSGGPVAHVIDIWQAAAPGLPLAADVYSNEFEVVAGEYAAANAAYGLPLLLPELRGDVAVAAKAYAAIARLGVRLFTPFAIDSLPIPSDPNAARPDAAMPPANPVAEVGPYVPATPAATALLAGTYRALRGLAAILPAAHAQGRLAAITQSRTTPTGVDLELGGWRMQVKFPRPLSATEPPAAGLVLLRESSDAHTAAIEVVGYGFELAMVRPKTGEPGPDIEWLAIVEGAYDPTGNWVAGRNLNGDELGIRLPADVVSVRRARMHRIG